MNRILFAVMSSKLVKHLFTTLLIIAFCFVSSVEAEKNAYVPKDMKQWEKWVMHGNEKYVCPSLYNSFESFKCVWPELLNLDFKNNGGRFDQKVTALSAVWFQLPGDNSLWPLSVIVNGQISPVVSYKGRPSVQLREGVHSVSGIFKWAKMPESIPVAKETGFLALRINNRLVQEPYRDRDGRLWIQKRSVGALEDKKEKNIISTRIFRLIDDDVPIKVETLIRLTVSGDRRREKFENCLPDKTRAVSVTTSLPVKLSADGTLWVDVRPGQWDIRIINIINTPEFTFSPATAPYGDEIWSFRPHTDLRIASVKGADAVDPVRSMMPEAWKKYSSYLVEKGDVVEIKEIQRGRPEKMSDTLFLERDIWLDFDGNGATVRDKITGSIGQNAFFSMKSEDYDLGRVSLNGVDQLVTVNNGKTGIELERGRLNMEAVSRFESFGTGMVFTSGWEKKFQSAKSRLNIPPGFRVFGVKGGSAGGGSTWIDSWSMLDFFLILVVSFAVGKLFRWWWGILFFSGLLVMAHEPGAPFYIWLVLIVTTALYKITASSGGKEPGSFRLKTIKTIHGAVLLVLCGISLVFISSQLRTAVYPQLEKIEGRSINFLGAKSDMARTVLDEADDIETIMLQERMDFEDESVQKSRSSVSGKKMRSSGMKVKEYKYSLQARQNLVTQTGPGVPDWQWRSIMVDHGQASENQEYSILITGPFQNSFFSVLRVIFLMIMIVRISSINPLGFFKAESRGVRTILTFFISLLATCFISAADGYSETPDPLILKELEERLTEAPDCFPSCAFIPKADIKLPDAKVKEGGKQFTEITITVNAAVKTAVPLPSGGETWQLYDLSLDGKPYMAVISEGNKLWTLVPEGVHKIKLRGVAFGVKKFRFSFPLNPAFVETDANGWVLSGINSANQIDSIVQATLPVVKKDGKDRAEDDTEKDTVSDFLRITRRLTLGMEWTVVTEVERFVRSGEMQNIVAEIPLLNGELVKTESRYFSSDKGIVTINLPPDLYRLTWYSSIPVTGSIKLSMDKKAGWSEVWALSHSSMWHTEYSGLPAVYPENTSGYYWYPWPGEGLIVNAARLDSAPGESMTVDSAKADYYMGKGYNRVLLRTKIRTTSGRTHTIKSPENSVIEKISINGHDFPLSGKPDTISLPLRPGTQTVDIEWSEANEWDKSWIKSFFFPRKLSFPAIDFGHPLNNIDIYFHLPEKLWIILTNGPRLGPAVLAWSLLGVVILAALLLGRVRYSPLGTGQWVILGIGLLSLKIPEMILVACWFIAMEIRKENSPLSPFLFNLTQIVLAAWTLLAAAALFKAIAGGLAGIPDMQIAGNGSTAYKLHWTLDQSEGLLPKPWVFVYSVYIYQIIMLLWALWLSMNILGWAKLFVTAFKSDGTWRPVIKKIKAGKLKK